MVSCFTFCFCVLLQTAFLHVFVKNDILQLGAYDHSVLYATAQLTEGRSARDQPKQPPAKKKVLANDRECFLLLFTELSFSRRSS